MGVVPPDVPVLQCGCSQAQERLKLGTFTFADYDVQQGSQYYTCVLFSFWLSEKVQSLFK